MEKKNNKINSNNFLDYIEDEELNKDIYELNLARKKVKKRLNELKTENKQESQNRYDEIKEKQKLIDHNLSENFNSNKKEKYNQKQIEFLNRNNGLIDRFKDIFSQNLNIDPGRLLALTDGIFGMVMTLLAFGIELPTPQIKTSQDIFNFIVSTLPTVGTVLVSFILVSTFWVYHHEVIKLKNMDTIYLWLNILYLASLSFIPFTTSLMGSYGQYFIIECVFIINIFIITILFTACVRYANNKNYLENTMDNSQKKYYQHTFLIISLLTIIVVLGNYFINSAFTYLLILTPFIFIITQLKYENNSNNNY